MNKVIENIKKGKTYDSVLEDGYKYYSMIHPKVTKEELINILGK